MIPGENSMRVIMVCLYERLILTNATLVAPRGAVTRPNL